MGAEELIKEEAGFEELMRAACMEPGARGRVRRSVPPRPDDFPRQERKSATNTGVFKWKRSLLSSRFPKERPGTQIKAGRDLTSG